VENAKPFARLPFAEILGGLQVKMPD